MNKILLIPLVALLCAFTVGHAGSPASIHPAAKECSDCGCSGPDGKGICPMEKEKTCKCSKSQ